MPQVTVRRPFGELDLCDQLRFEPHTVFHFLVKAHWVRFFTGRLANGQASISNL
jgi:hypothetical protein